MTLDAKALDAAFDAIDAAGAPRDIECAIQAYLDAAGLAPRVQMDNAVSKARMSAVEERDEARREADDYLHELVDERARADDAFKQLAALREALDTITRSFWTDGEPGDERVADLQEMAKAALAYAAKAAAQWVRVDDEHVVVPLEPTNIMASKGSEGLDAYYHGAKGDPGHYGSIKSVYRAMIDAAPKAGEPESD